jgi:hypothetical protein
MAEKKTRGYDDSKDKIVKTLGEFHEEGARSKIVVCIRAYDGGTEKVAIQRQDAETERMWKLGRLTVDEAVGIGKLLAKAATKKGKR